MNARHARRWLPALALATLIVGCRPAGPRARVPPTVPVAPAGLPDEEPTVRVGIVVDTSRLTAGADVPFEITTAAGEVVATGDAGEEWTLSTDARGRILARDGSGRTLGPLEPPVQIRPRGDPGVVRIAGRPYRGGMLVRSDDAGRLTAINVLELEEYLLGVVPAEIPSWELEAVKAQAVAARTYAISHLGNRAEHGFDFFATVRDQVYGGLAREDPMATRAVRETRGEIVVYDGRPILAYYHSTCGGSTAAIEEVWGGPPRPYLEPVSDKVPGTEDEYYCDASSRFRWDVAWRGGRLAEILRETLAAHTGRPTEHFRRIDAIEVLERTPSGRVGTLAIAAGGVRYLVHGDSVRWVLRPEPGRILNSALFELEAEHEAGGVARLVAHGGGWGHGIGMCQFGAIGRASAGQSYREILTTYYRNTDVVQLY